MRSPLDPLPNAASMKAAVAVFALVVAGIGLTVGEYVRSTGPAARAPVVESKCERSRPNEVRAAAPRSCDRAWAPARTAAQAEPQAAMRDDAPDAEGAATPAMFSAPASDGGG